MAYAVENFPSKKALKEAVAASLAGLRSPVRIFNPGLGIPAENGAAFLEGPHYPKPHRWYAKVEMSNGAVVRVS